MHRPSLRRTLARRVVRQIAYGLVAAVGLILRLVETKKQKREVRSILVIRLDLLGDVLFSMQAVAALRKAYPESYITMLTLPYTEELARSYSEVDRVIVVDTNRIRTVRGLLNRRTWMNYWSAYRAVRASQSDLAVSLSGRMGSLWAFLSGAPSTIGYAGEAFPFMLSDCLPGGRYRERKHEVQYVRSLAAAAGAPSAPEHLHVPVGAATIRKIDELLLGLDISKGDRLVALHAGSINGSAKRWPTVYWAQFADKVHVLTGARVVLVGAESDLSISRQVQEAARLPLASLVGRTSISELVALIARADLVATGDSGPLHIAVALGRPLVSIYGPTDPAVHGPFHPSAPTELHRRDLPCSPCYSMSATAECPLGDPICMWLVTVDSVVSSAVRLLSKSASTPPDRG